MSVGLSADTSPRWLRCGLGAGCEASEFASLYPSQYSSTPSGAEYRGRSTSGFARAHPEGGNLPLEITRTPSGVVAAATLRWHRMAPLRADLIALGYWGNWGARLCLFLGQLGQLGGTVVPFSGALGSLGQLGVLRQFRSVRWRIVLFGVSALALPCGSDSVWHAPMALPQFYGVHTPFAPPCHENTDGAERQLELRVGA